MPVSMDKQMAAADVYAGALFDLARASGDVETVRGELEELNRLRQAEPAFDAFVGSAAVDADRRARSLEKMFRGRLSDLTLNALLVMNRHERLGLIAQVLRRFVVHQEEAEGQVEVTAMSATGLPEDQRQDVTDLAAKLSGKTPIMEWTVDPDIIGGLILQIGDVRYDYSVRRQLNAARKRLFERSDRGLGLAVAE